MTRRGRMPWPQYGKSPWSPGAFPLWLLRLGLNQRPSDIRFCRQAYDMTALAWAVWAVSAAGEAVAGNGWGQAVTRGSMPPMVVGSKVSRS